MITLLLSEVHEILTVVIITLRHLFGFGLHQIVWYDEDDDLFALWFCKYFPNVVALQRSIDDDLVCEDVLMLHTFVLENVVTHKK